MPAADNDQSRRKTLFETITCNSGTAIDRRNQYVFVAWCFAWAVMFTASNWLLKSDHALSATSAWVAASVPNLVGVGMVLAYLKFLRQADELIRKMQIEGLATGFGVGILFALGYQVFERAGAPHLELDDLAVIMMAGWMAGQLFAYWRYR